MRKPKKFLLLDQYEDTSRILDYLIITLVIVFLVLLMVQYKSAIDLGLVKTFIS